VASNSQDAGPLFNDGGSGTLRLVTYLILAIVLMVADHRGQYLTRVRQAAAMLSGPIYWLAALPAQGLQAMHGALADRGALAAENETLRQQLLVAQARLARLAAVQDQNSRLRELLDARSRLGLQAQLAELIDVDLDPFRQRMLINLGTVDGVRTGQAVMDSRGVLGQIVDAQPERATLILITDPGHSLPVRVVRTGLRTIANGTGDIATLNLPHIPFSADIRIGDQLVTSGLGGNFPAGLPVGVIRQVEPDDSATFVLAQATPSSGMSRSGEVLVLHDEPEPLGGSKPEAPALIGPPDALPVTAPAIDASGRAIETAAGNPGTPR
jgi:rod shape-determining protein MreC